MYIRLTKKKISQQKRLQWSQKMVGDRGERLLLRKSLSRYVASQKEKQDFSFLFGSLRVEPLFAKLQRFPTKKTPMEPEKWWAIEESNL